MKTFALLAATALFAHGAAAQSDADFEAITQSVLEALGSADEEEQAEVEDFLTAIEDAVEQAKAEGRSDSYIDSILAEAATGAIRTPEVLRNREGVLDRETVLAVIVASSLAPSGQPPAAADPTQATTQPVQDDFTAAVTAEAEPTAQVAEPEPEPTAQVAEPEPAIVEAEPEPEPTVLAAQPVVIAPTPEPEPTIYTVQPGDSLAAIAEVTYGSRDFWRVIFEANRDQLRSPDLIVIGQQLVLPPAG